MKSVPLWSLCLAALIVSGCSPAAEKQNAGSVPTAPSRPTAQSKGPDVVDPDAPTDFHTLPSGLKYKVLRKADGPKPKASDSVLVHYKGWLDDGSEFDSSYKRGEPIDFPLRGVIPGWTEGLQFCPVGGLIELEIPGDLGYGARGTPDGSIPPNATLHFRVELLEIL